MSETNPDALELTLSPRQRFYRKLLAAQDAAQPVSPSGQFAAGPLKDKPYVSDHDTTAQLAPLLRRHGLVLTSTMLESRDLETEIGKNKTRGWLYTARVGFTLTDVDTGYCQRFKVEGRALTDDNRGPVHAIANASRVFLMRLLQVPMAEPDQQQGHRRRSNAPPPQRAPQGPGDPGQMADGRPRRIPEARGMTFDRSPVDGTFLLTNGPQAGLELITCGKCSRQPMIPIGNNGEHFCIDTICGHRIREPKQAPPPPPPAGQGSTTRPAPQAQQPPAGKVRAAADELEITKRSILDLQDKLHVYDWQIDAIRLAIPEFPDDLKVWGQLDYQMLADALRRDAPATIKGALGIMAKREPADRQRVEHLRNLIGKAKVPFPVRMEGDEAANSGWHDAVEGMIERLEAQTAQGELPVGGQKARAR